ncbi:gas vesicle protein GvpG [Streptomyces sp. WMMC940]|uniref:gas vesicle protein GvpG n=1 Tax=Streptomyces sp. WMMC940 TaxID=3015153 RepID=UPI0022B63CA7|nr:gas vesicle protein GvpG [Streptomyces sp. WMMC940]MCZ7456545.1 gas vesicle protein GvpG [Streptomyces sp. WMMC940]
MGLITQIVTLPLAPVRGVAWVMDRVLEAAENEYYDPEPVQRELAALEAQLRAGEIDEETFDRHEDELLDRLEEIRAFRQERGLP